MVDYKKPSSVIKGARLKKYFLEHVERYTGKKTAYWHYRFWKVTSELKVFKIAAEDHIIALKIPVGAIIHAGPEVFKPCSTLEDRKMRASRAFVHSIYRTRTRTIKVDGERIGTNFGDRVRTANSRHDYDFEYIEKKTVKPIDGGFSYAPDQCAEGIHFFLNFNDALRYS